MAGTPKQSEPGKRTNESGLVSSSQADVHPNLEACVRRHLDNPWLQPFHQPSCEVFHRLKVEGALSEGRAIILDSGCGTGKSTQHLAGLFPSHNVIGVDQSTARLSRDGRNVGYFRSGNCILLRAELSTFWRLLLNEGCSPERHYLLYPNPWPKPAHLKRRWHGHPVFPRLLGLGGEIEMRCNWEIYAREFARAVNLVTGAHLAATRIRPEASMSPFERKYCDRGHELFSVIVPADLPNTYSNSASTSGGGV